MNGRNSQPPVVTSEKRLTWEIVAKVLRELAMPVDATLHGYYLSRIDGVRLECGSGIAGRSYHWHVTQRNGTATASVTTRKELRRLLREWAAGPKPHGARYARMNHNRSGDAYIWVN